MERVEKFITFTIIFCWKLNKIEYSITIVKEEVLDSGSNQEALDSIIKRVFNQLNVDNFEEFTLMFVSDIKEIEKILYESINGNDTKKNVETVSWARRKL